MRRKDGRSDGGGGIAMAGSLRRGDGEGGPFLSFTSKGSFADRAVVTSSLTSLPC